MMPCLTIFTSSRRERTTAHVRVLQLTAEADEMWSFVGKKANKQWIWMALDSETRQVIAFYVGDRSRPERQGAVAANPGGIA